jgi:hypothetical protein
MSPRKNKIQKQWNWNERNGILNEAYTYTLARDSTLDCSYAMWYSTRIHRSSTNTVLVERSSEMLRCEMRWLMMLAHAQATHSDEWPLIFWSHCRCFRRPWTTPMHHIMHNKVWSLTKWEKKGWC